MAPFRNPFNRRPTQLTTVNDENAPPANGATKSPEARTSLGSRTSSVLSIKTNNKPPDEFKLSGTLMDHNAGAIETNLAVVVNDSGVYLPVSIVLENKLENVC